MITDSEGNLGVAASERRGPGRADRLRDSVLAGTAFNRNPRIDSPSASCRTSGRGASASASSVHAVSASSVDYVANVSRDQIGLIDINEPVNGVRPGVDVFDPNGSYIPPEARGTNFQRVLLTQTNPRVRRRLQVGAVLVQQADGEPLERAAGLHAAVEPLRRHRQPRCAAGLARQRHRGADYGRFASDRRQVLAGERHLQPVAIVQRRHA